MTRALVLATYDDDVRSADGTSGLTAADRQDLVDRICRQLRSLGIDDIQVLTRPAALRPFGACASGVAESPNVAGDLAVIRAVAGAADDPLVLCTGDLVAHDSVVTAIAGDGVRVTTALVGPRGRLDRYPPALRQRGRVISVGSAYHRVSAANCALHGLLKVASGDLASLVQACDDISSFVAGSGRTAGEVAGAAGALGLVTLALTRGGTPVFGHRVRLFYSARVVDRPSLRQAEAALRAVDEPAVQLRLAVKEHDDFFATYCVSSFSPRLVRLAARCRLTPTGVTWISVGFAAAAAAAFGWGTGPARIAGAVLLYLGFVFDCVDGQLARYTHTYSRYGGWLDAVADRWKEFGVYSGLAIGAVRTGAGDVWVLAIAALVLQTTRHMTDTWYGAVQDEAVARLPRMPLECREDALGSRPDGAARHLAARVGIALGRASARLESNRASAGYWLKRTVVFPIGERWLLIAVTAALFDGGVAFAALLGWGSIAAVYTLSGRTLRTRAMRVPAMPARGVRLHRDDGAVARVLGTLGRGGMAPLPAVLVGLLTVVGLLVLGVAAPAAFGWRFADDRLVAAAALALMIAGTAARHPHDGALDWLVAAALRATEFLFVVLVGLNDGVPAPLLFALLAVVALYHYDLAARLDKGASPVRARWLNLGWDGRVTVLAVAAVLDVAGYVVVGLATYLLLTLIGGALAGLAGAERPLGRPVLRTPPVPRHAVPDEVPRRAAAATVGER